MTVNCHHQPRLDPRNSACYVDGNGKVAHLASTVASSYRLIDSQTILLFGAGEGGKDLEATIYASQAELNRATRTRLQDVLRSIMWPKVTRGKGNTYECRN